MAHDESRRLGVLDEAPEVGEPGVLALRHGDGLVHAHEAPDAAASARSQLEPGDLIYDRHYGIKGSRSGDFVIINIESDAWRRGEKEALLACLSDKLAASPGIARDDVFVRLSPDRRLGR